MLVASPTPPFNFDLSSRIFSEGDEQVRRYENGKYWQAISVNGKLILVTITSPGTVERPELLVELKSGEAIYESDRKMAETIIYSLFNLDLDLNPFYEDVKRDRKMALLTQKLRGLKSPTTATVFEALVCSIIEQQISLNVAHALEKNVVKALGDKLTVNGGVYYSFPSPGKMASAKIELLRKCGLSSRKAEYIRDISKSIVDGKLNLEKFKSQEETEEIIDELTGIRGVGIWTAELTLIRGMAKLEAIPADDLGIRRCISYYYRRGRKISGAEARRIAGKWGKWKGLASYYLLTAERLGMKI